MAVGPKETAAVSLISVCALVAVGWVLSVMPSAKPSTSVGKSETALSATTPKVRPDPDSHASSVTGNSIPIKSDPPFIATPTNKFEWNADKLPVAWPPFTKLPNESTLPKKATSSKIEDAKALIARWNLFKSGSAKSYPTNKETDLAIRYLLSIDRSDPAFPQAWATFISLKQVDEAISDEIATAAAREAQKREAKHRGVSVGMTAEQIVQSSWGKPQKINVTITARGKHEQWVYAGFQYLYLEDGVLASIQTSR
jgi:hypothetical protein